MINRCHFFFVLIKRAEFALRFLFLLLLLLCWGGNVVVVFE